MPAASGDLVTFAESPGIVTGVGVGLGKLAVVGRVAKLAEPIVAKAVQLSGRGQSQAEVTARGDARDLALDPW